MEMAPNMAVFGLIVIIAIISLSIYFFHENFSRKTPLIFFNELQNYFPTTDFANNTFSFYLSNGQVNLYDTSIFHFNVLYMKYAQKKLENGTFINDNLFTELAIEPCKQEDFNKHNIQLRDLTFCIGKNNNISFSGSYGDISKGYNYLNLFINRCENITTYELVEGVNKTVIKNKKFMKENFCKPPDVIEKTLANVFFGFGSLIGNINHNDFENPLAYTYKYFSLPMSSTIFKRYYIKLRNIIYETDMGLVFENKKNITGFISPEQEVSVDLKVGAFLNPSAFGQFTFQSSTTSFYYKRFYSKFQAVIANIGGALNALSAIGTILLYYLSKNEYFLFLMNKCFEIDEIDENYNSSKVQLKEKPELVTIDNNKINMIKTNDIKQRSKTLRLNFLQKSFPIEICCRSDKIDKFEIGKNLISEKLNYLTIINNMMKLDNLIQISLNSDQKICLDNYPKSKILKSRKIPIFSYLNNVSQNNFIKSKSELL